MLAGVDHTPVRDQVAEPVDHAERGVGGTVVEYDDLVAVRSLADQRIELCTDGRGAVPGMTTLATLTDRPGTPEFMRWSAP